MQTLVKPNPALEIESKWRNAAAGLALESLETDAISDLRRALAALRAGQYRVVQIWVEMMEAMFIESWDRYHAADLLEEEITCESVIGHHMLCEGVEGWLEVLARLSSATMTGRIDELAVVGEALKAQRLLVAVQLMEKSTTDVVESFRKAWLN